MLHGGSVGGKNFNQVFMLLEQDEIDDINSSSGVYCDHMQLVTSSAVLTYRPFTHTTITGQMLFRVRDFGQQTREEKPIPPIARHIPRIIFPLSSLLPLWDNYKMVLGFDVINVLDQQVFLNHGEGSIGLRCGTC